MKNPRLTKEDFNQVKGALRRAFTRTSLYKEVVAAHRIEHSDPRRPRCEKWSWCGKCGEVVPTWTTSVDHIEPVVPLDRRTEDMSTAELEERIWCARDNLWVLCDPCHSAKSKVENRIRRQATRKAA